MKKWYQNITVGLLLVVLGFTQEGYQVPGFPAFAPAPTMLELIEDKGETVVVPSVQNAVILTKEKP